MGQTLLEFMRLGRLSQQNMADRLGCNRSTVSKLTRHILWPSREMALRIRGATEGAVTIDTFLDPPADLPDHRDASSAQSEGEAA